MAKIEKDSGFIMPNGGRVELSKSGAVTDEIGKAAAPIVKAWTIEPFGSNWIIIEFTIQGDRVLETKKTIGVEDLRSVKIGKIMNFLRAIEVVNGKAIYR